MKHNLNFFQKKAKIGWIWGSYGQVIQKVLIMLVSIIMARILEPSDFGLIASVSILIIVAQQVIDSGISDRIIQKKTITETDYSTFFFCNLFISIFILILFIFIAKPISNFYENNLINNVVICFGVIIFFMNAGRIQWVILNRNLKFKTCIIIRTLSVIFGCFFGLTMALNDFGFWALVGQQMSAAITLTLMYWIVLPWLPKEKPSWAAVKDIYSFGTPIIISESIRSSIDQFINIIIAKNFSQSNLGYYDRGKFIPENIHNSIKMIFGQTNFAVLSHLKSNNNNLSTTFLDFLKIRSVIIIILLGSIFICANDIVLILLGQKWMASVWFLKTLCLSFAFLSFFISNQELLKALGKIRLLFKLNILSALIQIIMVLLGFIYWEIKGIIIGDIISKALCLYFAIYFISRDGIVSFSDQTKTIFKSFFICIIPLISLFLVQFFVSNNLIIRVILCMVTFFIACIIFLKKNKFNY